MATRAQRYFESAARIRHGETEDAARSVRPFRENLWLLSLIWAFASDGWEAEVNDMLSVWASRTALGRLEPVFASPSIEGSKTDRALLISAHVEQFWISTLRRSSFRAICLAHFAGVTPAAEYEWPKGRSQVLLRVGWGEFMHTPHPVVAMVLQMALEFESWLWTHPMPKIHRIATAEEEMDASAAQDVQVRSRKIGTEEAATMLRMTERGVRAALEKSKLLGYQDHTGEWVIEIGDVRDYDEKRKMGRPVAICDAKSVPQPL